MFKFIHAADIHLDSPLRGLDKYEGAPVDAIRSATRRAFSNLVRLAISERVSFVILAGDIFDIGRPDFNAELFFVSELRELEKARIDVVWLRGNHDAKSKITKSLKLPDNSKELSTDKPETIRFDAIRVAVHGQGFATQAEKRNLADSYPPPVSGYFNIGVLHTALEGRDGHAPYAPCTLGQLLARNYGYWALGHVHDRRKENGTSHPRVEFPGNIQGRHIGETGPKGCLLVSVDANHNVTVDDRELDVFRWAKVPIDADPSDTIDDVMSATVATIADARENSGGRPLAVRLLVSCGDAAYRAIANDLEHFRFDLAGQVGNDVWIEKIELRRIGEKRGQGSVVTGDAASELRTVLTELQADSEAARDIFADGDCGKLAKLLPPEIRYAQSLTDDDADDRCDVFAENCDEIIRQAETLLSGTNKMEDE